MNTTTNTRGVAMVTHQDAAEALDSLDDYARMGIGVDAHGPRGILERYIAQQSALSAPEPAAQGEVACHRFIGPNGEVVTEWEDGMPDNGKRFPDLCPPVLSVQYAYTAPPAPRAQPAERVPEGMVLCRERLQREGKPYPRSSCAICGKWAPKWRDCDILLSAASVTASPAPSEGGKGVDRE